MAIDSPEYQRWLKSPERSALARKLMLDADGESAALQESTPGPVTLRKQANASADDLIASLAGPEGAALKLRTAGVPQMAGYNRDAERRLAAAQQGREAAEQAKWDGAVADVNARGAALRAKMPQREYTEDDRDRFRQSRRDMFSMDATRAAKRKEEDKAAGVSGLVRRYGSLGLALASERGLRKAMNDDSVDEAYAALLAREGGPEMSGRYRDRVYQAQKDKAEVAKKTPLELFLVWSVQNPAATPAEKDAMWKLIGSGMGGPTPATSTAGGIAASPFVTPVSPIDPDMANPNIGPVAMQELNEILKSGDGTKLAYRMLEFGYPKEVIDKILKRRGLDDPAGWRSGVSADNPQGTRMNGWFSPPPMPVGAVPGAM